MKIVYSLKYLYQFQDDKLISIRCISLLYNYLFTLFRVSQARSFNTFCRYFPLSLSDLISRYPKNFQFSICNILNGVNSQAVLLYI